jgi:hypothetical protein
MPPMLYLHALHYMHDRMAPSEVPRPGSPSQDGLYFLPRGLTATGSGSRTRRPTRPSCNGEGLAWSPNPAKGEGRWLARRTRQWLVTRRRGRHRHRITCVPCLQCFNGMHCIACMTAWPIGGSAPRVGLPRTVYTFFQGVSQQLDQDRKPVGRQGIMQWRGPRLEPNRAKGEGRWLARRTRQWYTPEEETESAASEGKRVVDR